jgi:transcriptional regulator with XRE-family HTH domain
MDMAEMIRLGSERIGSQKELAETLGIAATHLSNAKKGERGLPLDACFALAKILDISPACVSAASALVTEKDEKKREVFYPFVVGVLAAPSAANDRTMTNANRLIHIM